MHTYTTRSNTSSEPVLLQRRCACGGRASGNACGQCKKTSAAPDAVHDVLRSPAQPLDATTRAFMEPRFGHDFSDVRVHADPHAAESAETVNALAYTAGREVIFGSGQYAPHTSAGRKLIAHELVHVMQQTENAMPTTIPVAPNDSTAEREAEETASVVAGDRSVQSSLTRQPFGTLARVTDEQLEARSGSAEVPASGSSGKGGGGGGTGGGATTDVYMCSQSLETSPMGSHAFFRTGAPGKGNPTISLQPIDASLGANCWQGVPDRNYDSDLNAEGTCEKTTISSSCLETEFASYPIGHYCTFGPNSNTFVGHIAKKCGVSDPDPAGWTPGIDDKPPPSGTFAPSKWETLKGCSTKQCIIGPEEEPPIG